MILGATVLLEVSCALAFPFPLALFFPPDVCLIAHSELRLMRAVCSAVAAAVPNLMSSLIRTRGK